MCVVRLYIPKVKTHDGLIMIFKEYVWLQQCCAIQ